ncbi:MAG: PAS domain-containing protein [Phycisphaerae bacterium]|nr:PAS domain-containing protein [Phycisphaerae bacterium]
MTNVPTSVLRTLSWAMLLAAGWLVVVALTSDAPSRGALIAGVACGATCIVLRHAIRARDLRMIETALDAMAEGRLPARFERPQSGQAFRVSRALGRAQRDVSTTMSRLTTERNELQAILEALGNGLIALDREQRIRSANRIAEQLLGLTGDYRGQLLQQATRQPDLSRFVSEALAASGHLNAEIRLEGVETLVMQAASEPLPGSDGRIDGLLVVLDDITRLKRLESMRTDFAANVSHELRTPITNIKGYVETLQEIGYDDPPQVGYFIEIIHRNTRRLSMLVEDLLSLASLDQIDTRTSLEFEELEIGRVLGDVQGELGDTALAKQVALSVSCKPGILVFANRTLVHQAVANLVSNAIKYSPTGSTVEVEGRLAGDVAEIEVVDNGPGIPAKHLPRIFERFYRVDKARSRELGGTGLGLALVKHIALAHGGAVDAQSVVGKGSRFTIRLPLADAGKSLLPEAS